MKHLGLFEGIGGFSLAARWMGWETVAWCEWNEFGQKVLKHHFPKAEGFGDITKTDFKKYANKINLLTGGFPCQGFSLAGNRLGTEDDRYLWPEMLRCIEETNPDCIIGENVTGILSMEDKSGIYRDVFPKVEDRKITRFLEVDYYEAIYTRQAKMLVNSICEDIEARGYEVQPMAIPAASVGAPHKRERIWFIAYRNTEQRKREIGGLRSEFVTNGILTTNTENLGHEQSGSTRAGRPGPEDSNTNDATNSNSERQSRKEHRQAEPGRTTEKSFPSNWTNFPTQSPVRSRNDGVPNQLDGITFSKWRNESIKAYGNAIVPQVAYEIFKAIEAYEQLKIAI